VDVTKSPVEGAINYFKFTNQETDRQLASAAKTTGKAAPQAFADTILDDPMILPVGPDTNFPLFFFAAPRSNLSAPSYNRLAEAPYIPVSTQLQLVNSSGRVLPVRDSTGQGLERLGDSQRTVLGKANLNFKVSCSGSAANWCSLTRGVCQVRIVVSATLLCLPAPAALHPILHLC
jgi:hypothetical protein